MPQSEFSYLLVTDDERVLEKATSLAIEGPFFAREGVYTFWSKDDGSDVASVLLSTGGDFGLVKVQGKAVYHAPGGALLEAFSAL